MQHINILHFLQMFRHGDRTASSDYPLDPYRLHPWPDGRGQLLYVSLAYPYFRHSPAHQKN